MKKTIEFLRRIPAEGEYDGSIFIASPDYHTDWSFNLQLALAQYRTIVNALTACGEKIVMLCSDINRAKKDYEDVGHDLVSYLHSPYNDTWIRDYGLIPSFAADGGVEALDFGFNGWGLKFAADNDNLVNLCLYDNLVINTGCYKNYRGFIFEGGSMETDGKRTLLTTSRCLLSPNRNPGMSKEEIEKYLCATLGMERILWLDYGELEGDDTDAHIDTLARFAPEDTILYVSAQDKSDNHYESLKLMEAQLSEFRTAEGKPYRLIPLPMPSARFDSDGLRLPATYANFLVTPKNVFVPVYDDPVNDGIALERIAGAFPGKHIEGVPCNTLVLQHGSLHCSTMQIIKGILDEKRLHK